MPDSEDDERSGVVPFKEEEEEEEDVGDDALSVEIRTIIVSPKPNVTFPLKVELSNLTLEDVSAEEIAEIEGAIIAPPAPILIRPTPSRPPTPVPWITNGTTGLFFRMADALADGDDEDDSSDIPWLVGTIDELS